MPYVTFPALADTDINPWCVFEATPGKRVVFLPDAPHFTIAAASQDMCRFLRLPREQFVGKGVFEAFPDNPSDLTATGHKNLLASLEYVLHQKKEHQMEKQRYDVAIEGGAFKEIYWQNNSVPVFNEQGDVACIVHTAEDITELVKAEQLQQNIQGIEKAYHLFMQAPMMIAITRGENNVLELANENALRFWGKTAGIIGKPLLQAIPELDGQGILHLFDTVRNTGQSYSEKNLPVVSTANGHEQVHYFDVVFQPYHEEGSEKTVGVFTVLYDVTERILTRKKLEEKEQSLALAIEIGRLGTFQVDLKTNIGHCSPYIMEWMGLPKPSLPMMEIFSRIHPDDEPMASKTIAKSIAGERAGRHDFVYRVVNPQTGALHYLRSIGQVQFENEAPVSISGIIQDETQQMLSLKQMAESEERLRFALDAGHLGFWELNLKTMELDASKHCKLNFGQPLDQPFLYQTLQECIHPDDRQRQNAAVVESVTTGNEYNVEYRVMWPDDSIHWMNIRGRVQASESGAPERMIGVSIDITDQVNARTKIEESEAKYRNLFDSMDQGVCVIEILFDASKRPVDYLFLEVNSIFEQQTGLKGAVGKTARELVPGLEDHWFEIYGNVALTGEPVRMTEGSAAMGRVFDLYAFRVGGADSQQVAVLFTEITQRKLFETVLLEKDANLRNIIQHAPVAMFIFRGENMVIDTANAKALDMIQRTQTIIGKPLLEAIPELNGTPAYAVFEEVYRTGLAQYGQEVLVPLNRNGVLEERYFNFAYTPLMEEGNVVGVIDVATEVTEQVLARQKIEEEVARRTAELAAANKELQRSNAQLEEFAHAASHDLKEPIRKIHFFTNQLKNQLGDRLKENEVRSFGRIENATQRMGTLIDDLLLYSHVSLQPHETEAIDLNQKMKRVIDDLELSIQEKGAIINVGDLPMVQGYRRQLQQLFQNLISNALKYSKAGQPPQIDIRAKEEIVNGKRYHSILVRDNGIGFDEQYTEKIFQMFSRLHGKAEYSGTGVGLSIVKKVVENHNGFIRVESKINEGSLFKIYLPA